MNASILVNGFQDRVFSYHVALGNRNGEAKMKVQPDGSSGFSMVDANGDYTIAIRRMPDYFPDKNQKFALMKVDIEVRLGNSRADYYWC